RLGSLVCGRLIPLIETQPTPWHTASGLGLLRPGMAGGPRGHAVLRQVSGTPPPREYHERGSRRSGGAPTAGADCTTGNLRIAGIADGRRTRDQGAGLDGR